MKFAAFALVAFASSAAALPFGFVEQCCARRFFNLQNVDFEFPAASPDAASFREKSQARISGYNEPACIGAIDGCIDLQMLCEFWSYDPANMANQGIEQTGILLHGSNDLLCCPIDDPECDRVEPLDNPWTCATFIRWGPPSDDIFKDGPDATQLGWYCGRTDVCKNFGLTCGDPHFQTFSGEWYDFHGECDMNFLEVPDFGMGLGMKVQIRTKARYEYSFVEAAALQIGDDVLEVSAYGQYFLNGVESANLKGTKMADKFEIEHDIRDAQHSIFNVYTGRTQDGKAEAVQIKVFKDLVAVKMVNAYASTFESAVGMMGDFEEGKMIARDGKTIISDAVEFGMEWQVTAEETNLFQTPSPITGKCAMPSKNASAERRRLAETVPLEAAVAACEAVDTVHHENCVYDVMATGDLEIAHAGVF